MFSFGRFSMGRGWGWGWVVHQGQLIFNDHTLVYLVSEWPLDFCLRELQAICGEVNETTQQKPPSLQPPVGGQTGPSILNYLPYRGLSPPSSPFPAQLTTSPPPTHPAHHK